jgi:hypothetical protein
MTRPATVTIGGTGFSASEYYFPAKTDLETMQLVTNMAKGTLDFMESVSRNFESPVIFPPEEGCMPCVEVGPRKYVRLCDILSEVVLHTDAKRVVEEFPGLTLDRFHWSMEFVDGLLGFNIKLIDFREEQDKLMVTKAIEAKRFFLPSQTTGEDNGLLGGLEA